MSCLKKIPSNFSKKFIEVISNLQLLFTIIVLFIRDQDNLKNIIMQQLSIYLYQVSRTHACTYTRIFYWHKIEN